MLDPWMSHSQYDEPVCWRCETGCGEHRYIMEGSGVTAPDESYSLIKERA